METLIKIVTSETRGTDRLVMEYVIQQVEFEDAMDPVGLINNAIKKTESEVQAKVAEMTGGKD